VILPAVANDRGHRSRDLIEQSADLGAVVHLLGDERPTPFACTDHPEFISNDPYAAQCGISNPFVHHAVVCACGVAGRRKGGAPAEPGAELEAWLADARTCGIGAIETFAAGLETDNAAVRAALIETWSSGQAEGQVNRLKLLKRQSYGRASFDLLRRRVLLAA
jgi:hypothetical protein